MASKGKRRFNAPVGRPGNMMRQLEELQKQMSEAQAALEEETVTASVGGGAVTLVMSGAQEVKSITIKPEAVDPEDVELLQDLLVLAFREARDKAAKLTEERMGPLAGGLEMPGLF
ncbi:MAG: YbaB/EbfC family nucleoid-associated protein [Chloroflexi bacterium]|jgi:DNA-binding YbaB/EbfC family protein|nr:YbaB/EbfC family nucleoid-associated protein [Chloroflexota bacterium]